MKVSPPVHQGSSKSNEYPDEKGLNDIPRAEASAVSEKEFTAHSCLALLGALALFFVTIGFINAFGVFQEYYLEHQLADKSASAISWLGSFNVFCLFGGSLGTGILSDMYGPAILMWIGGVITVFSMLMTSFCNEYYHFFLAQGFLLGIGIAFLFCPCMATIPLHFKRNRGLALGIVVSGSSLGGVIWPIALQRLLVEVGFGWTVRVVAFMMLALCVLGCLTVRLPVTRKESETSEPKKLDLSIAKGPQLLLISTSLFFIYLGLFSPFFYITSYTVSLGLDANMAFYMISILNAASLPGRLLPGVLADRYGVFNLFILASGTSGVICFCWIKATSIAGIVVYSLAYGFSSGAIISLMGACVMAGLKPAQYGTAMGLTMSVLSTAALIGPPINGQLLDGHGYIALSTFSGAGMLVGTAGMILVRWKINRTLLSKI